jgi:uncharacterized protein YodC (DUF2158 family)
MVKVGDLVIKNTGGNKMKVVSIIGNQVECAWVTESFNQQFFPIDQIIPLSDYKSLFKEEKRDDKIEILLKS